MKVLVTGGAGYKGVVLSRHLADLGHDVTVYDNFMYGTDPVLSLVPRSNVSFVRKDIRDVTKKDVDGYDAVYHLAGLSGFPACDASPSAAQAINVDATITLASLLEDDQILVFASSGSIYGRPTRPAKEDDQPTELVSRYAKTKWESEKAIRALHGNHVIFRWATVFGISPRMRWELMPNDFVRRAVQERVLVLYSSSQHQMLIHIEDVARVYAQVLDNPDAWLGETFNVGDESMNPSKLEMGELVASLTGCTLVDKSLFDPDRRDLIADFSKIRATGVRLEYTVEDGIRELVKLYQFYRAVEPYRVI